MNAQSFKRYIMPLFAFFIMLAGARAEGDTVRTWQWMKQYPSKIWGVQYSKTDKYIIAEGDYNYYFINPDDGKEIQNIQSRYKFLEEEKYSVNGCLMFIKNDSLYLLESEDRKTINCYNTANFTIENSFEAPGDEIISFDVSRDEQKVVAKVAKKGIIVWDLETRKIIANYKLPTYENEMEGWVKKPRFTPDGNHIIVSTHFKIKTGTSSMPPYYYSQEYNNLVVFDTKLDSIGNWTIWDRFVWSKSGKLIASVNGGGFEWVVRVFDAETFKELYTIHTGALGSIGGYFFSDDEEHFVFSYGDQIDICKVFRLNDGKNTINYHPGNSSTGACLSNSGKDIVFATSNYITKYPFSTTSSIGNEYFDNGVISYPNPIIGSGVLKFNQEKSGFTKIYISDEKGSVLKEVSNTFYDAGQQAVVIDVSDLANGAYFVTVTNDSQNFTNKIIVNK